MNPFPHIPNKQITHLLIGERYYLLLKDSLKKRNITAITLPGHPYLDIPVQYHADMLLQHIGMNIWVAEPSFFPIVQQKLQPLGQIVLCGNTTLQRNYPLDIAYNGLRIGNSFFHLLNHTDKIILQELKRQVVKQYSVKQGYSKCSVVVIHSTAAITSDLGMAKAMRKAMIDVLTIQPGHIQLPGYHTGLIGGCCFLTAPNRLAVTGILNHHPDYQNILNFLNKYHITLDILTEYPVFDIGSAFIL